MSQKKEHKKVTSWITCHNKIQLGLEVIQNNNK